MRYKYFIVFSIILFYSSNIFSQSIDSNKIYIVDSINIIGNQKTNKDYIIRECDIQKYTQYLAIELERRIELTRNNLYNTSLFNIVNIQCEKLYNNEDTIYVKLIIDVVERWYIWPSPVVKSASRNFNDWWYEKKFSELSLGVVLAWNNFSGRGDKLYTLMQIGYNNALEINWESPYINKKKTIGLQFSIAYNDQNTIKIKLDSNKVIYSQINGGYALKNYSANAEIRYKKNLYNSHSLSLKYDRYLLNDSLFSQMPYLGLNNKSVFGYFSVNYLFKRDLRDYKEYPLKGYYLDFSYMQNGIGISKDSPININIESSFRKYMQLTDKLYFGSGLCLHYSNNKKQAYFLDRGLGYSRFFVRGYEDYVIDGQSFLLFKSNIKYALIPKLNINLPIIKSDKFKKSFLSVYLSINYDMAYIDDNLYPNGNYLANKLLMGGGLGIDFVSYYDLVMRIEYSYNNILEHGFYIHFMTSI